MKQWDSQSGKKGLPCARAVAVVLRNVYVYQSSGLLDTAPVGESMTSRRSGRRADELTAQRTAIGVAGEGCRPQPLELGVRALFSVYCACSASMVCYEGFEPRNNSVRLRVYTAKAAANALYVPAALPVPGQVSLP